LYFKGSFHDGRSGTASWQRDEVRSKHFWPSVLMRGKQQTFAPVSLHFVPYTGRTWDRNLLFVLQMHGAEMFLIEGKLWTYFIAWICWWPTFSTSTALQSKSFYASFIKIYSLRLVSFDKLFKRLSIQTLFILLTY
jgi:hypothetical protein